MSGPVNFTLKLVAVVLTLLFSSCVTAPKLEMQESGTIDQPTVLGMINTAKIKVIPNGREVFIEWDGYNTIRSGAFKVPFDVIKLRSTDESYIISNLRGIESGLEVNGRPYRFDKINQHLVISFGEGVFIEDGDLSKEAVRIWSFNKVK